MAEQPGTPQIGCDHAIEIGDRSGLNATRQELSCGQEHAIQCGALGGKGGHGGIVTVIQGHAAGLRQGLLEGFEAPSHQDQLGPFGGEAPGRSPSQAAPCAGNQDSLVLQISHGGSGMPCRLGATTPPLTAQVKACSGAMGTVRTLASSSITT